MMARRPLLAAVGLLLGFAGRARAGVGWVEGVWTGAVRVGGDTTRIRFSVAADGAVVVTVIGTGRDLAATAQVSDSGDVIFTVPGARGGGGGFRGNRVGPDNLVGVWRQAGLEFPLTLLRGEAGLAFEPTTRAAQPLTQEALTVLKHGSGVPALAAAAERRGGGARIWATGERMSGESVTVTPTDQWLLGSIGKSILATTVGRLVDQGRASWDDTLGEVIGARHAQMQPAYRAATYRHLLSHRAGLIDNATIEDLRASEAAGDSPADQSRRALDKAFAAPPAAPLGTQMAYSNMGYRAVASMLETSTGQDWRTLVRQALFVPLGLKTAGFGAPGRIGALDQPVGHGEYLGAPYRAYPLGSADVDLPEAMAPAGSIHMNLGDLLTYLEAHRDHGALLRSQTWDVLHTPPFGGNYAMGWEIRPDGSLWHNGSDQRWYAEATFDAQSGIVAAAVANDGRSRTWGAVSDALLSAAAAASRT
jgi:CubicO group peptidase (beta-lactamase class C family)